MIIMHLRILPGLYAVVRLEHDAEVPAWATGGFLSITRTAHELSIVCEEVNVPPDVRSVGAGRIIEVEGPLDFSLTGVLTSLAQPLAAAGVSIFALSTFDTDYLLVREAQLAAAKRALTDAGHEFLV